METWEGLLLSIGWFVLRFGVPIMGTALIVHLFKRLDQHWQNEVIERRTGMGTQAMFPIVKCWAINNCPEERCKGCVAYQDQSKPCWQHFRAADGTLKDECLGCKVFLSVSAPAVGD